MPDRGLALALVATIAMLAAAGRRAGLPDTSVFALGGLALALVPGIPRIALPPALVLVVFLPPLIFAAAQDTSWAALHRVGYAAATGIAIGVGVGWIGHHVLSRVGDAAVENTVTLLHPFAAVLPAEQAIVAQLREGTDHLLRRLLEIEHAQLQRIRIGTDLDTPVARRIQSRLDGLRLREGR